MDINELIIYRNLEYQELFQDMACLMGYADSGSRPDAFHCAGQLVESLALFPGLLSGK